MDRKFPELSRCIDVCAKDMGIIYTKGIEPKRRWYLCPKCGKKLASYEPNAHCEGVHAYCRENGCKCEYEIKIGCAPNEPTKKD